VRYELHSSRVKVVMNEFDAKAVSGFDYLLVMEMDEKARASLERIGEGGSETEKVPLLIKLKKVKR